MFPANRNRNRFTEPTSLQIVLGIVCKFPKLGIGIVYVRREVLADVSIDLMISREKDNSLLCFPHMGFCN